MLSSYIECRAQSQANGDSVAAKDIVKPDNQVLDVAKVFVDSPEILSEIVTSLSAIEQNHSYPVYLVIYHHVLDSSLRERADQLYESWIGDLGRGMVIVYQLDPVAYGDNPAMAYHKGDGLDLGIRGQFNPIPERDIAAMLAEIMPQLERKVEAHPLKLRSLVQGLEREMTRYHDIPAASWADSESLTMIAVFSAFVIVIALIGLLIRQLLLASSNRSNKKYYFPAVQVAHRLGAPYGGGWVSEKSFDQVSPQHSDVSPG
ncbi:MAG: TPM domain-containing protein [Akkermansiaceae bacterium]|nr:TPM domain-containing protein [Akkermansiaceae bacterium]